MNLIPAEIYSESGRVHVAAGGVDWEVGPLFAHDATTKRRKIGKVKRGRIFERIE